MNLRQGWTKFCGIGSSLMARFHWNPQRFTVAMPQLVDQLDEAQKDWNYAKLFFNNVTDPDLIDYAIYYMEAAEKKYIYLLKRAREKGMSTEQFRLNQQEA